MCVQDSMGLLWVVVVLALGKPLAFICYLGKSPTCEPPTNPGDVIVKSIVAVQAESEI